MLDKLERDVAILKQMDRAGYVSEHHLRLMVDQAKRVRRTSTILVRALAEERDNRNATA